MYFTNIGYKELQNFHEKIKVNFRIPLRDITDGVLFKKEELEDLLKIYPLFYTDKIESNNANDRVMENKCIICENRNDTILYFIADESIPILSLDYDYYGDFEDYIVFYLYDGVNGNSLHNVTANISFKEENTLIEELELNSNRNGIIYIDTSKFSYDEVNISFSITDKTKTFNWSSE